MRGDSSIALQAVIAAAIAVVLATTLACAGENVPRMSKEDLKGMLGNPDAIILDVRSGSDWSKSDQKIQGAVREGPDKPANTWAEKYPKDKTIVLYCA